MSMPQLLPIIVCVALLPLQGCGQIKEERKAQQLESATSGYRQALRWGYHEAALQFIKPQERPDAPSELLGNIRVTSYEVIQAPIIIDETKAEQLVRIEYVLNDRQRLEALSERQQWEYDEEGARWWLTSGMPAFQGN